MLSREPESGGSGREARIDAGERAPVRLVFAMSRAVGRDRAQPVQFGSDPCEKARKRQLCAQRMDLREIVLEGDFALGAKGVLEHVGGDEGIAVAVAADPAADA